MRAIWNGFISFGLVTIPVAVGIAQQRSDISFRNLAKASMRPVKQKRFDPEGDVEVSNDDLVKGWEVAKGQYIAIDPAELEQFAVTNDKTIQILQFVNLEEIDPVYFERAYWLEPQERVERPYALLVKAMQDSGRAALGRFVLSTKEHLVLLRPMNGALALQTLYYPEDVRLNEQQGIAERLDGVEVSDAELAMAAQLIESQTKPFAPEDYPNQTRNAMMDFLNAKAAGETPIAPDPTAEPAPVVDLMAALKASLEQTSSDASSQRAAS